MSSRRLGKVGARDRGDMRSSESVGALLLHSSILIFGIGAAAITWETSFSEIVGHVFV